MTDVAVSDYDEEDLKAGRIKLAQVASCTRDNPSGVAMDAGRQSLAPSNAITIAGRIAPPWFQTTSKIAGELTGIPSLHRGMSALSEGDLLEGVGEIAMAIPFAKPFQAARGLANASAYSVVFETTIAKTGAGTREAHKALANRELAGAMSDKEVAQMLSSMNVTLVGGTATPAGFRWHHAVNRPGVMQLVPEAQHAPGSIFQLVLHPGGSGGFAQWGRGW